MDSTEVRLKARKFSKLLHLKNFTLKDENVRAKIPNDAVFVGRPRIVTDKLEANAIAVRRSRPLFLAFLFKTTLYKGKMPEDCTAGKQFGISERSFRSIRLRGCVKSIAGCKFGRLSGS